MSRYWRRLLWVVAPAMSLLALLVALLRGRSPWEARAKKAQDEATAAGHAAIDAVADKDKAEVIHDAKNAADIVAGQSDADLYAEALDELGISQRPGD